MADLASGLFTKDSDKRKDLTKTVSLLGKFMAENPEAVFSFVGFAMENP